MAAAVSASTISTVKATIPALEAHGLEIVTRMYARLFETPELAALFNKSHHEGTKTQPKALAAAVLAYATYIETPEVLASAIERIAQKHTSLQILSAHYAPVGAALLGAIADVLGEAATPEILAAWGEAYGFLADVLIAREADLYAQKEAQNGGWTGWREFNVIERITENALITTFTLAPTDGGAVMAHIPGQYLALALGEESLRRTYSISCAPNSAYYQITVKREGAASIWLHDEAPVGTTLQVAAPAGDFTLAQSDRPMVFLAGGVGITPLRSMIAALSGEALKNAHLVYSVKSADLAVSLPAEPARFDLFCAETHGRVTQGWLAENVNLAADFYICGPKDYMKAMIHALTQCGVPSASLHYEFFGPAEAL